VNPRRLLRRFGYAMAGLVSLFLLPFCAGALWQAIASHRDLRQNPPPGRLVDVGGYRMHINSAGAGSPIVILESGLSDSSLSWYKVQPEVARFVRVVSYDRAGLGWSDPSPQPRNSRVFAEELHTLLHNAGVPAPFVLVGHSMGGYDVRMFASLYRSEVAGMVLVDASHPDLYARAPGMRQSFARWRNYLVGRQRQTRFGIPRLRGWCDEGVPQPALRAVQCRSSWYEETLAELDGFPASGDQVRPTGSLGDMPLAVLTEDPDQVFPRDMLPAFLECQDDLARLSTRATHVVAKGSGHQIQKERPDLVIAAIRQVVEQVKAANPGQS
jgi:pimeloyl-ACP methyl ester carboxylesterase